MASEMKPPSRKRARRCARDIVADGTAAAAAGAARATAPAPLTLLSLPDEALAKLFALLSTRPGVALSRGSRHAHALAAAHPRLDRLFRCELVTRLEINASYEHGGRLPDLLSRAVERHPRATALALKGSKFCRRIDIVACAAPRLKVVEINGVALDKGGDVAAMLARCRGLEVLRLVRCEPKLSNDDLSALVSAAGPQLRVLSLYGSAWGVTDAGGSRLRDLTALTDLNLDLMYEAGEATFHAIAALPALALLHLRDTRFSDEYAARTLPGMDALRELNVSNCEGIGPRLWAALPPTLRVLRADYTALLDEAPGDACAAALAELHVKQAKAPSWAALSGPHVRALRILSVTVTETVDDEGADAALEAMPQLEELDLSCCWNAGDGTAAAVARHAALRIVDLGGTNVGPEGVRALRRWEADGITTAVRGERKTAGRFPPVRTLRLDEDDSSVDDTYPKTDAQAA